MTVVIIESFHATLLPASNFPISHFCSPKKIAGLIKNGQLTTMIPTQGLTKALFAMGGVDLGGWAP